MEAKDFYDHVMGTHQHATVQSYGCPICILMGMANFRPRKDTNLYRHVKHNHSDLTQSSDSQRRRNNTAVSVSGSVSSSGQSNSNNNAKSKTITKENLPEDVLSMVKSLGSRYVVDTVKQSIGTECTICYEEFMEGIFNSFPQLNSL